MFLFCDGNLTQRSNGNVRCEGSLNSYTHRELADSIYSYLDPSFANNFRCNGNLTLTTANTLQCSEAWELGSRAFDPATLDPVLIAGAVGAGIFSMTLLFSVVFGARCLIKFIK